MNAPTLLIGLGGTGCKIVERVSYLMPRDQQENIAYAVFDTDVNDLRRIRKRSPFIKTIQTSVKETVGEYLDKDKHALNTWFPVNGILNSKTLTEGAGQVRSISRLALDSVIRAGKMTPLHEAIQSLYKIEEGHEEQALRVVIVSSLAGGTGSGLLLPIAMYVKKYLQTHFRQSANIVRGFFLLPEVFYEVISGETERSNLKANAYATLRELDAFLMKGDNTLHPKYHQSVTMEFPMVASRGYEEYNVRPYDYCFLFDAQNADGGKLNSFDQYLDHAANCIYAQSISPMNARSNSAEDNVIRKLTREKGRNRYAGAGASMLIYPFEDIRTFIALQWAKECVSERWLVFDNMYKELCADNAKKRALGMAAQNPKPEDFYVQTIESQAKQGGFFAKELLLNCEEYAPDGVTLLASRWQRYVRALRAKVETDLENEDNQVNTQKKNMEELQGALSNRWEAYADLFIECEKMQRMAMNYIERTAPVTAYSMFKAPKGEMTEDDYYRVERYLMDTGNEYLHPNAIRYLLNKMLSSLEKEVKKTERRTEELKAFFSDFEAEYIDDKKTKDKVENVADMRKRKVSILSKLLRRPEAEQVIVGEALKNYRINVEEFMKESVLAVVLKEAVKYVRNLISAFGIFYKNFETKVKTLDQRIDSIYRKYEPRKGETARYVCASRKCLERMNKDMLYTGSSMTIDPALAKRIYEKILVYATMDEKPRGNKFFSDLFDEDIIGYFENSVMMAYGNVIDVDILTAIEKEAVYEKDIDSDEITSEMIEQYVQDVVSNTRALSCPFIENALGDANDRINSCTFSTELLYLEDAFKKEFVKRELQNNGGEPDEEVSKYMIMFYRAIYGLRARDLGKFAPPRIAETVTQNGGEYFNAYYELIRGIHPNTKRSSEISPHADRRWHIVTKMPDLDDTYQRKQEQDIYAAFFWGILGRFIDLYKQHDGSMKYKLRREALDMEDDELIVSNGTDCDKLYEVLDAIAIYPALVQKILDKKESLIREDLDDGNDVNDGVLSLYLETFSIKEPRLGKSKKAATSIFSLPLLMKKSTVYDQYYEEDVIELLKVVIEEVKDYFARFFKDEECVKEVGAFLMQQFELYLADMEQEKTAQPDIYQETLFDRTVAIIENAFDALKLKKDAKSIARRVAAIRK